MLTRYRHIAINSCDRDIDPDDFKELKTLISVPLPQEFSDFLTVAHGGTMGYYMVDVPTGIDPNQTEPIGFDSIYRLSGERTYEHICFELISERKNRNVPEQIVPFARDGGGSTVYLDLTPEEQGRVVAFVTGLPEWAGKRQRSQFIEVASSFPEYIDKLYLDEEEIRDELEQTLESRNSDNIQAWKKWLEIALPQWRSRFADLIDGNEINEG